MKFSSTLLKWYQVNKRDLPWRNTHDPYVIWLSEIILQQTRVSQGLPYFYRFTEAFPTIADFAAAEEDKILKLWQGLGYYSRARNMHQAARQVHADFKGKFPDNYTDLLILKGVGEYTAAAIASFAYNLPHPVVDGNVFRFLSRYFGIDTPINSADARDEFRDKAFSLMDKKDPAGFNQAMMEFGALQCKPGKPDCNDCIFSKTCFAFRHDLVNVLPVKIKAGKVRRRYFHYLYITHDDGFFIRKRTGRDIWQHLYELPMIETAKAMEPRYLLKEKEFTALAGNRPELASRAFEVTHQLTHQTIHAAFYRVSLRRNLPPGLKKSFLKINENEIDGYAFPKLIENYLSDVFKEN